DETLVYTADFTPVGGSASGSITADRA
ncbi:hypothetical protein MGSAQ_001545, partial [marine sediment metagenome]